MTDQMPPKWQGHISVDKKIISQNPLDKISVGQMPVGQMVFDQKTRYLAFLALQTWPEREDHIP